MEETRDGIGKQPLCSGNTLQTWRSNASARNNANVFHISRIVTNSATIQLQIRRNANMFHILRVVTNSVTLTPIGVGPPLETVL